MQSLQSVKRGNSSTGFTSHFQSLQQMEKSEIRKVLFCFSKNLYYGNASLSSKCCALIHLNGKSQTG